MGQKRNIRSEKDSGGGKKVENNGLNTENTSSV